MNGQRAVTVIYGILHFFVDFCCAFFLLGMLSESENLYLYFLIYNFCAFALQMPFGLLADRWKRNNLVAASGCLLTAMIPLIYGVTGMRHGFGAEMSAVVLTGLGNCLFHVGGGIEILEKGRDKLTPLGIFVSPGAIGIFLGSLLGKADVVPYAFPYLILLVGTGLLLYRSKEMYGGVSDGNKSSVTEVVTFPGKSCLIALFCFFFVVILRSHLGMVYSFPWKKEISGGILGLMGVVFGKAAGGVLADKFGVQKTILFSMVFAMLCFCFSGHMIFGVLGLFFFNMTMPITLYLAAEILERNKGFAFGILTFAIFIGYLPAYFGYLTCTQVLLVGIGFCSLIFLEAGYGLMRKKHERTVS
ncbi:MAG: hypothetical protein ACI4ER_08025 [Suilimivivens sp.]